MSKERARRREAREREAAERAAAVAAASRRRERRRALVAPVVEPIRRTRLALRNTGRAGKQNGPLAQRRRTRTRVVVMVLLFLQVVVWLVRPDWQARLGALVIALIAFPVIAAFTL